MSTTERETFCDNCSQPVWSHHPQCPYGDDPAVLGEGPVLDDCGFTEQEWDAVLGEEKAKAVKASEPSGTASPALVFRTLADVAADVDSRPPRRYVFEPVVAEGDYGVLTAEDKAGKTWAAEDAMVSCAAGLAWMGEYPCRSPGPVLGFLGEGSEEKALRRVRAIGEAKGLTRAQVDALPIVLCFRVPHLSSIEHLALVRAELAQHRPKLVVLDPLYLAAKGANGADLYAMGALLGAVQQVVQEVRAALMLSHHWNKTGTGSGHNRSSGVGPGAWGRFLISMAVGSSRTDPLTLATTVRLKWMVKGDETPDMELTFVRRVWAEDPRDLNSPLHYRIEVAADAEDEDADDTKRLTPAERKFLEALDALDGPRTVVEMNDWIAAKYGNGLRRETCSRCLNHLAELDLVDHIDADGVGRPALWVRYPETPGQPRDVT